MINKQGSKWVVVTDLDGTMLNHDSYEFDESCKAIGTLKARGISVVLNTSKTYAETIDIRRKLEIDDPFIVENGSCMYFSKSRFASINGAGTRDSYWEVMLGSSKKVIDDVLETLNLDEECYVRLSQCSVNEAIKITGLTPVEAKNAINREFSEPFIWKKNDESLEKFIWQLEQHSLAVIRGGRFLHVTGSCDKGLATKHLISCYTGDIKTIALGDSENDADMLDMADISIVVNSPSNVQLRETVKADIYTAATAPHGWREGIDIALARIDNKEV